MSYPNSARWLRDRAAEYRRKADSMPVDDERVQAFDRDDRPALIKWLYRRLAQEDDTAANELEQVGREDVTVSERGPRR